MKRAYVLFEYFPLELGANRCREKAKVHEQTNIPKIEKNLKNFAPSNIAETFKLIGILESDLRFFSYFLSGVFYRYSHYIIAEGKRIKDDEKKTTAMQKKVEKELQRDKSNIIDLRKKGEEKKYKDFQKKLQQKLTEISKDETAIKNIQEHLKELGISNKFVKAEAKQLIDALKDAKIAADWADINRNSLIMGSLKKWLKERSGAGTDALLREFKNAVINMKDFQLELNKLSKKQSDAKKRFALITKIIENCIIAVEISEKIMDKGVDENLQTLKRKINELASRIKVQKNTGRIIRQLEDAVKKLEETVKTDKRKIFVNFMIELNKVNNQFSKAKVA